jgi:hypothetical protein
MTCSTGLTVDHAVLLVGYGTDYWIIKNQWGINWGIDGYIKITKSGDGVSQSCLIGDYVYTMDSYKVNLSSAMLNSIFGVISLIFLMLVSS